MSDFGQRLAALSPEKRALFRQRLRDLPSRQAKKLIPRRKSNGAALATPLQEQLWVLDRLYGASPLYSLPFIIRVAERLSLRVLDAAIEEIVRRHETLRTAFRESGGKVWQEVHSPFSPEIDFVDFRRVPEVSREARLRGALEQTTSTPFGLSAFPLVRFSAYCLADASWVIVAVFHHIIADAWSGVIFERELRALLSAYSGGRPSPLPPLEIQYLDYTEWRASPDQKESRQRQLDYWKNALAGAAEPARLPAMHGRGQLSFAGALEYFQIDLTLKRLLKEKYSSYTPFIVLLTVFLILLHHELTQQDIIIGTPIADRRFSQTEPLIGLFLNFLLLRVDVHGDATFHELLHRVRSCVQEALDHQDVTPREALESAGLDRHPSFHTPCHITFGVQQRGGELTPALYEGSSPGNGTSKFDFSMILAEADDGYAGVIEYRTGLFSRELVRGLAESYVTILGSTLQSPDMKISSLSLYPADRRDALLALCRGAEMQVDPPLFCQRFTDWVKRRPDAAAITGEKALTYSELDAASIAMAQALLNVGVAEGDIVAVILERSASWVAAFLAVLRIGAVYMPVDPAYPLGRIDLMLTDSGAVCAIAKDEFHVSALDRIKRIAPLLAPLSTNDISIASLTKTQPAYAIYTSGSTGAPKAALLSHGGLAALAEAQDQVFEPTPSDRVISFSSIGFDASIFELVMALAHGAALHVAGKENLLPGAQLGDTLEETKTTILTAPPSVLSSLTPSLLPALRIIIAAGEACPASLVAKWSHGRRFFNAYGPTECTVWSAVHECVNSEEQPPIGRPIPGMRIYVLNPYDNLCPEGGAGEIVIAGSMVGLGYLNRPHLTASRFSADFLEPQTNERLYRSGDRGRMRSDGSIEFLGRLDRQVKVRGYRVEPEEIERALGALPGIKGAAVIAEPLDSTSEIRLFAYILATGDVNERDIRDALADRVPSFLVPSRFFFVNEFPLTAHGKIDYRELRAKDTMIAIQPGEPLSGKAEEQLGAIWKDILQNNEIFADSDFFLLGGHSLLAGRLLLQIRETFGNELTLQDIFEAPQLRNMADRIQNSQPAEATSNQTIPVTVRARITNTELRARAEPSRKSKP